MRTYTVTFQGVSISAVQDLIAIYCGTAAAVELHEVTIGQITQTTVQNIKISVKRLPTTVTSGSGGSAGTVSKTRSGDAAATATARTNDTTQATTTGTAVICRADDFNPINGYQWLPAPEDRIACNPSEAIILSLDGAPGSTMSVSASLTFRELIPA